MSCKQGYQQDEAVVGQVVDVEEPGTPAADKPHLEQNATVQTTAVNIICNILGGGVLVLPQAFEQMSLFPAIFVTFLMGGLSAVSFIFLIIPTEKYQLFSYKELLSKAFHRHAGRAFDGVLLLYTFGVLIEYAKIVAQALPDAAEDVAGGKEGIWSHELFWIALAFIPFWLFSSMKQLSNLKWTSYLGIVTIYYVVTLVVVRFFIGNYSNDPDSLVSDDIRWFNFDIGFAKGLPVLSVCYSCHYNIPPYYGELKDRSLKRFRKATAIALPSITMTYVITGMFGYLMFGTRRTVHSKGNLMQNFADNDIPATIGQLGLFFHFCSVFPIVALGTRRSLNQILFNTPFRKVPVYIFEAFLIVSAACVLAYFASGVGIVVDIVGSLFSISIVYVIPGAIYLRLGGDDAPPVESAEQTSLLHANDENATAPVEIIDRSKQHEIFSPCQRTFLRGCAWCFVVGGLIASVGSFSITMDKIVNGSTSGNSTNTTAG